MGSKQVFSGRSEGISVTTEKAVSPEKNQAFGSAQRQNRTADTGIFNPPESAANADESRDFGAGWVAGGFCIHHGTNRCPHCPAMGSAVAVQLQSDIRESRLPRTTALAVEAYWRGEFAS